MRGHALPPFGRTLPGAGRWVAAGAIALGTLIVCFVLYRHLPIARVGDGMEYYGMFSAWSATVRPWMTDASFALYEKLHESQTIIGTLGLDYLKNAFPQLRLNGTADFNHFWFYSLLAAAVRAPFTLFGISLGAHGSFILLHAGLLLLVFAIAQYANGTRGVWAVVILTVGSPIIWYFNKIHTEWLTYCVTLAGIILAMRNQMIFGSVAMAIAATQNPGLSFVPVAMVALRVLAAWKSPYTRWEVAGVVIAVLLLALHPAYYLARYGVVTPQLLAGGASPGAGLSIAYIWLLDLDIGLFPNWPLGVALLVLGIALWRRTSAICPDIRPVSPWQFWAVLGVFFAASMYSHASTENLNSGATPGLARYALWYIPLLYPTTLAVVATIDRMELKRRIIAAAVLVVAVAATLSAVASVKWESYDTPTPLSRWVQSYMPWLYTPPAEVFRERYSGFGENPEPILAVVGPDCRKTLVLEGRAADARIVVPPGCDVSADRIREGLETVSAGLTKPTFLKLDPSATEPSN